MDPPKHPSPQPPATAHSRDLPGLHQQVVGHVAVMQNAPPPFVPRPRGCAGIPRATATGYQPPPPHLSAPRPGSPGRLVVHHVGEPQVAEHPRLPPLQHAHAPRPGVVDAGGLGPLRVRLGSGGGGSERATVLAGAHDAQA